MLAGKIVEQPLLTDAEINQLILAAPEPGQDQSMQRIQRGQMGNQMTSSIGAGSDFADLRAYHAGDELRHIDWRATARSRVPLIRTYFSELSQPVCLVIDRRASMRFATRTRLKVTQALRMALWLGGREVRRGRQIASVVLDASCHWLPPQQGLRSLKQMTRLANAPCPPVDFAIKAGTGKSSWHTVLSGLRQHIAQGTEVILLSDFYGLGDSDSKLLRVLGQYCNIRAIHVLDPSETAVPFRGELQLQWHDTRRYLPSAEATKELNQQLQSRHKTLAERLERANINYHQLSVELDEFSAFWDEKH